MSVSFSVSIEETGEILVLHLSPEDAEKAQWGSYILDKKLLPYFKYYYEIGYVFVFIQKELFIIF